MKKEEIVVGTNIYYGPIICKVEGHSFFRKTTLGCIQDGKDYVYLEGIDFAVPLEDCYGIEFNSNRISSLELGDCHLYKSGAINYNGFDFSYVHQLQTFLLSIRVSFNTIED